VRAGQSWVVGKYGSALEFEEGFLEVEGSHLLDLTTSMTLSAWLLPKAGEHDAPVLAKANEHQWEVSYLLKAGNWHHGPDWTLLGSSWANAWTYTRLPSAKWSHLAATYDGERLRLYLDGELAAETEFEGGARVTDTPLRIGGTFWGDYFRGRIDEVRIYNRALSVSEIVDVMSQPLTAGATGDVTGPVVSLTTPFAGPVKGMVALAASASDEGGLASVEFLVDGAAYGPALRSEPYQSNWHSRSATPGSHELRARATDFAGNVSVSAPITVSVAAGDTVPGLVAAFGFDEGSGEDVRDATGAGHDTVRSGQDWVTGKYGGALEFNDGFLEVEGSHLLDLTTAMTVSAWVLPKTEERADMTLLAKEYEWETSYVLNAATWHGGPEWALFGSSWESVSRPGHLPATRWSHLAGTYDGAWLRLYVDGELTAETEFEGGAHVTDTPLRIGGMTWGRNFRGRIDEVRIYSRALSASEIVGVMSKPVTDGATADLIAPAVSLTAPAPGPVSGVVVLAAQATDASGVRSLEFLVDGAPLGGRLTSEPFEKRWHAASRDGLGRQYGCQRTGNG
jgi:hypothetical protein